MTQMQIEKFTEEEYHAFLAYGDPIGEPDHTDLYDPFSLDNLDSKQAWISTLDSTTYPGMTFGYRVAPYMYTSL